MMEAKELIEGLRESANAFAATHRQSKTGSMRFLANRMLRVRDELDLMLREIDHQERSAQVMREMEG